MHPSPGPPASPDLSARDRCLKAHVVGLTPAERLAAMRELIDRSGAALRGNPAGMSHFLRRNFRARAIGRTPTNASHAP